MELVRQQRFWSQLAFSLGSYMMQVFDLLLAELKLLLGCLVYFIGQRTQKMECVVLKSRQKLPENGSCTETRMTNTN